MAEKKTKKPVKQPAKQQAKPQAKQPVKQPAKQQAKQPAKQQAKQQVKPPVKQEPKPQVKQQVKQPLINPFEIARQNIDTAAKKMKLDPGLTEILKNPQRMLELSLPIRMRNGHIRVFKGFRCQYNDLRGPTLGGISYDPALTADGVMANACWMMLKCAVANIPYGGASGGIVVNPSELNDRELEALTRRFAYALRDFIGPDKDIPTPDVHNSDRIMAWFVDTYSTLNGTPKPAVITGKPVEVGGSHGRTDAVGRGCVITIREAVFALGIDLTKASVAVVGMDDAGAITGQMISDLGATIIAVCDQKSGIYNPNGLNIGDVIKHQTAKTNKDRSVKGFPGSKPVTKDKTLELNCDILIAAESQNIIAKTNARKIRARIVAEASNGTTTPEADEILFKNNVFVVPDILANAGGESVAYFEWVQNIEGLPWTEEEVAQKLERQMIGAFRDVYEKHRKNKIDMRTAAYMLAIERIAKVFELRGLWP